MQRSTTLPIVEKPRKRRVKIVDEIIETLRQDIVSRRLPDGERLPNEKDLSERFGVSQPTVREAIRALETIGLVEVYHGRGTFVRSQGDFALASALQTLLQLESVGIMDVLEVRQVLGRYSMAAAASNATDADIAAIEAAARRFDKNEFKDADEVIACVIEFQRVVSAASHKVILQSLEAFLLTVLNEVQVKSIKERDVAFWWTRAVEFQPHRLAILNGIRSREQAVALEAIDHYFEAQRTRFEQDKALRSINLASPGLITMVSDMVRQSRD